MIVFAGNLHSAIVNSLLGSWSNENIQIVFTLIGKSPNLSFNISVNGEVEQSCKIHFSEIGECTIVCNNSTEYPINAMLYTVEDDSPLKQLRLQIGDTSEHLTFAAP